MNGIDVPQLSFGPNPLPSQSQDFDPVYNMMCTMYGPPPVKPPKRCLYEDMPGYLPPFVERILQCPQCGHTWYQKCEPRSATPCPQCGTIGKVLKER